MVSKLQFVDDARMEEMVDNDIFYDALYLWFESHLPLPFYLPITKKKKKKKDAQGGFRSDRLALY